MRHSINQLDRRIYYEYFLHLRSRIHRLYILWTCNRIRLLKIVLYSEDNTRWRPRNREAHNTL